MRAYSNSGHLDYEQHGSVNFLPAMQAYYNRNSLANILGLSSVTQFYRVTIDSAKADRMLVHLTESEILHFNKCGNGLYFLNLDPSNKTKQSVSPYSFASNKEFFSRREIEGADKARIVQSRIGWPSNQEFIEAIRGNLVINATITVDDIRRAIAIYSIWNSCRPNQRENDQKNAQSNDQSISGHHPTDELDIDFLYDQGAPYLLLKTQKIKFQSVQCFHKVSNKKKHKITYKRGPTDIINGVKKVIAVHTDRGFKITCVNGDNEFRKIDANDPFVPSKSAFGAAGFNYRLNTHPISWWMRTSKTYCLA